jgi:peptidyl-prolyl cis-trans isomerase B (cyclophilin B)
MWIDKDTAFDLSPTIKGYCTMDVPPMIENDRTLIPLRAFSELFGAQVNWDGATMTASVDMDLGETEVNTGYASALISYVAKCSESYDVYKAYVNGTITKKYATIEFTDGKSIKLELYPDIAPKTVDNFIKLASNGFYDGLAFHRVIKDFMIQGGGYTAGVDQAKEADTIPGEFANNYWLNLIPHERGTISMARTSDPDSASSQFFIVHKDSYFLDFEYAAFGKVIDGMDVVDEIAEGQTQTIWNGLSDVPVNIPVMKTVTVESSLTANDFAFISKRTTMRDVQLTIGYPDYRENTSTFAYVLNDGSILDITFTGNGTAKTVSVGEKEFEFDKYDNIVIE